MIFQKRSWTLLLLLICFSGANAGECQKPILDGVLLLTDEAIMKNEYPDGSDIALECANGYEPFGSDLITCKHGQWSKPDLICKKKDCGFPEPSPNMEYNISAGTLFGASIKPICNRGYYLQGSTYRHCLVFGWSGKSFCVAMSCGVPPVIPHAKADKPHDMIHFYGNIINYVCEPGYTLFGNETIICQDTGNYTSPLPQCIDTSTTTIGPDEPATDITNFTTQYSQNSNSYKTVIVAVGIGIVIFIVIIFFTLWQHHKRKGSYILASSPSNDIGALNRTAPVYSDPEASM